MTDKLTHFFLYTNCIPMADTVPAYGGMVPHYAVETPQSGRGKQPSTTNDDTLSLTEMIKLIEKRVEKRVEKNGIDGIPEQ